MPKTSRRADVHYPTSIRLSGDVVSALDEEAKIQQRSRAFIITFILKNWLAFSKEQRKKKDRKNENNPV